MLIRHSLSYVAARGLPGLLNLAALLLYTRLLSADAYGRYALAIAGITVADVVIFQWQRLVLARWLPTRNSDPKQFLGEMLLIFSLQAGGVTVIGLVLAAAWPDPLWRQLLALAVLLLVAQGWLELNLVVASAQLAPGRYGRILGAKALVALTVGAGLALAGLSASAPLLGLLTGCALAVPLFGQRLWRNVRPVAPDKVALRQQLRYGLPLILTFALAWIIASSDRMLIGWLADAEAAGQYAVGYDLAQHSLGMLLMIIQVAAYPLAVRALETDGQVAAINQVRRNGELIVGVALAGAAGLAILAPQLSGLIVGPEYRSTTADLLPWVGAAAALGGIKAFHFDMAFHLGRDSRGLLLSAIVAAGSNIVLNVLLIPRAGILGAAYATLAAYAVGLILSAALGRGAFSMPSSTMLLLRAGCVGIASGVGAAAGGTVGTNAVGLLFGLIGGASSALVLAFVLDLGSMRTGFSQWRQAQAESGLR